MQFSKDDKGTVSAEYLRFHLLGTVHLIHIANDKLTRS